jgi:hypothetical protein
MYCSNCGAEASGNFCSRCGTRLTETPNAPTSRPAVDWAHETSYRTLIANPVTRDLISQAATRYKSGMSGEQFLDKFLFNGIPIAQPVVAGIIVPLGERIGFRTGKKAAERFDLPAGRVIVAVLCSLATKGQHLKQVTQADHGCLIEAVLPSDMLSWEGTLRVAVSSDSTGSRVEAETHVPGQLLDWGKSSRAIAALLQDIPTFATLQP